MTTEQYWSGRYENQITGWDIGYPSTPIKEYFDQIKDKNLRILIPGAGNGYEVEYLHKLGFIDVTVIDISGQPLKNILDRISVSVGVVFKEGNNLNIFDLIKEADQEMYRMKQGTSKEYSKEIVLYATNNDEYIR